MIKRFICLITALMLTAGVYGCQSGTEGAAGPSGSGNRAVSAGAPEAAVSLYDEKEIGANAGLKSPAYARIDSKNRLVVYDQAGKFVALDEEGKPMDEIPCALTGYLAAFDLDSKDIIYAVVAEAASETETSQKVCVIDASGGITDTFELGKYKNGGAAGSMPIVMDMAVGRDGRIYLAALNGIMILDSTGKLVKKIGSQAYYSIDSDQEDNIIAATMDKGKQMLEKFDGSTGKSVWSGSLDEEPEGRTVSFTVGSLKVRYDHEGKSIYAMDETGVYKYDGAGKPGGQVLDFKQYMILASGNNLVDLNIDGKGNIYVMTKKEDRYELYRYDIEGGVHEAAERQAITLAVPVTDRRLEVAALKFQKANPGFRIDIKTYEEKYDYKGDYENYVKLLNTELLTGKGPDIINTGWLSYEKYIDKNMFADLGVLMEQDKDFDPDRYYTNIFDAFKYKDGLYAVPVSIRFDLLAANKKILEEAGVGIDDARWTWADFREIGRKLTGKGGGRKVFISIGCQTLMEYMLKGNYSSFVNEQEKKAGFDSREFTDLLAMVKEFGDSRNDQTGKNANYDDLDSIENGTVVFNPQTMDGYTAYAFLRALYSDRVRLLSYPASGSAKGGVFDSETVFSINNNSKNKTAAWEFLKFLLSDEVQSDELDGFAVNKAALKKMAQKAIDTTVNGEMSIAIGIKGEKPKIIIPRPLVQGDIDYVNGFIENMRIYNRNNVSVRKIVSQEVPAFFSGEKSAGEVARLIQEKVNIYLGE